MQHYLYLVVNSNFYIAFIMLFEPLQFLLNCYLKMYLLYFSKLYSCRIKLAIKSSTNIGS